MQKANKIILNQINFPQGSLTIIENKNFIFEVKRVFYLYDIKCGENRGSHAHKKCHQLLIASSGSFSVETDNGFDKDYFFLNNPNVGLHIPPNIWASEINFSSGAICLVLASEEYDENDYLRNYEEFKSYLGT
jgi:hypothetical protein